MTIANNKPLFVGKSIETHLKKKSVFNNLKQHKIYFIAMC